MTALPKYPRYETYLDEKGEHRWRLRAANKLIVADSAEGYAKKSNAIRAAELVRRINRVATPIPIVHWEAGRKDVGGRRKGPQGKGENAHRGLGPRASELQQSDFARGDPRSIRHTSSLVK